VGAHVDEQLIDGRYARVEAIGRGGFGVVWRAHDTLLERDVAIKEIEFPPVLDEHEQARIREKVLREARAAARLSHPSLVTVYDVVEDDGRPFIVMELVAAPTLADRVGREGPLPDREVAAIGAQVLDALAAAHEQGIIHRDVKPANVMVSPSGRVQLGDFGIASIIDDPKVTSSGQLAGSPSYMAPEQANNDPAGAATDLWGLGATLYFAVEGAPPFAKDSALATLTSVVADDPRPMERATTLAPLLTDLLVKDPAARPSVDEVRRRLSEIAAGNPAPTPAAPPAPSPTLLLETEAAPPPPSRTKAVAPSADELPLVEHAPVPEVAPPDVAAPEPAVAAPAPGPVPVAEAALAPAAETAPAPAPEPAAVAEATRAAEAAPVGDEPPALEEAPAPAPRAAPAALRSPPRSRPAPPSRANGPMLLAGLAILLAVALVGFLASRPDPAPTGTSAGSTTAEGPDTTPAPDPAPDPAREEAGGSTAAAPETPGSWTGYEDPVTGFTISHPPGWSVERNGTLTDFRDPQSGAYLRVDYTSSPGPSPEQAWYDFETRFAAENPNYRRIQIVPTTFKGFPAAVWEFTYTGRGVPMRAVDLGFVTGRYGFALNFNTRAEDWSAMQDVFEAFKVSFQPPG
jgi:serine/threonine protein kinase